MGILRLILFILGGLFLVWALLVLLFGGDKYMKWYLRNVDESKYDQKKVKVFHVSLLTFIGICGILFALMESKTQIPFIILSVCTIVIAFFSRLTKK